MLVERPARRTVGSQRFLRDPRIPIRGSFRKHQNFNRFLLSIRVEQRLAVFCDGEAGRQAGAFNAVKRDETRDAVLR